MNESTELRSVQRRTFAVLTRSQVFAGTGLGSGATVAGLLAQAEWGSTALSGLPSGLYTAGSAAAAILVGILFQARGRRPGLGAGHLAGALGAAGVVIGGVFAPNLVGVSEDLAHRLHLSALSGPFLLAAVAHLAAAVVLAVWLRPDLLLLSHTTSRPASTPAARAAVGRELEVDPEHRTWHGSVLGVPDDFRRPTRERVAGDVWERQTTSC